MILFIYISSFNPRRNMGNDNITPDQNLDNQNIFEDFAADDSLGKEVEHHEENIKKDTYYYLRVFSSIMKVLNAFLFLVVGILVIYIFIQNNTTERRYSFLEPICSAFLGQSANEVNGCYSLGYYLQKTKTELEENKVSQTRQIASLLGDIYLVDNFIYSEVVNFLIHQSKNRLKPTKILSEFDALKNRYEPVDKAKITCRDIVVREGFILDMSCEAFSSDWDTQVLEVQGGILSEVASGGTSISIASSFIEFLESDPNSNFTVLNKQKVFFSSSITGKGIYTKKTPFTLSLRYNNSQTIDF